MAGGRGVRRDRRGKHGSRPQRRRRTAASSRTSRKARSAPTEKTNPWEEITTYNNYYEFGTDKDSPSMLAKSLKPAPWTVTVDGECAKKGG